MSRKVLVMDTSVLCCFLNVPGKETAGGDEDKWDCGRVSSLLEDEQASGSIFVLPLATIIETGNHIAQAPGDRFSIAQHFGRLISASALGSSPWAAFTDQKGMWESEQLQQLAENWPALAAAKLTIGDATIKNVAEYYAAAGFEVEIVTGDSGLKAYEPTSPVLAPRRRRKEDSGDAPR